MSADDGGLSPNSRFSTRVSPPANGRAAEVHDARPEAHRVHALPAGRDARRSCGFPLPIAAGADQRDAAVRGECADTARSRPTASRISTPSAPLADERRLRRRPAAGTTRTSQARALRGSRQYVVAGARVERDVGGADRRPRACSRVSPVPRLIGDCAAARRRRDERCRRPLPPRATASVRTPATPCSGSSRSCRGPRSPRTAGTAPGPARSASASSGSDTPRRSSA